MNIVILGAGTIGSYLATILSQDHHNVIVIDKDAKALDRLSRNADIAVRLGSGTHWNVIEEAKQFAPDFFIALSSDDETNILACAIAKKLGYSKTVARIRESAFLEHRQEVGDLFAIDHIVGTELVIAQDIFRCILNPGNLGIENFAEGKVEMHTLIIPENFEEKGKPLSQVSFKEDVLVGLIRRQDLDGKQSIIFPRGQDVLLPQDEVTIFAKTELNHKVHALFGIPKMAINSVVLVGGSGVAMHLTRLLLQQNINVKIIEQDEKKCLKLVKLFPSVTILNHDGTDLNFLKEENVDTADVMVTCTSSPETNVLGAALAKQAGCKEVIALISDDSMAPLLQKFRIAYSLSERISIAHRIHVILHNEKFISLASHYENQAKIMELKISSDSHLVGIPISQLSQMLPKNVLLGMIETKNDIIIPKGHHRLTPGDIVLVICAPEVVKNMKKIF